MEDIEISPLNISDTAIVEKFLKEEYYTREPTRVHLGISSEYNWMREKPVIQSCLEGGKSYGVFDRRSGLLCAISLNVLGDRAVPYNRDGPYPLCMKQFILLLDADGLAEYVANSGTKNYMELYILCVKDSHSKRGLATRLCEKGLEVAGQEGLDFVVIGCLSAFSRKITERLGFKVMREVVYEDYVDPLTGQLVMKGIPKPHHASTFLLLKL